MPWRLDCVPWLKVDLRVPYLEVDLSQCFVSDTIGTDWSEDAHPGRPINFSEELSMKILWDSCGWLGSSWFKAELRLCWPQWASKVSLCMVLSLKPDWSLLVEGWMFPISWGWFEPSTVEASFPWSRSVAILEGNCTICCASANEWMSNLNCGSGVLFRRSWRVLLLLPKSVGGYFAINPHKITKLNWE